MPQKKTKRKYVNHSPYILGFAAERARMLEAYESSGCASVLEHYRKLVDAGLLSTSPQSYNRRINAAIKDRHQAALKAKKDGESGN